MADSTIVFLILAAVVVLFVSNRVPVEIVAVGTALALWATGVLDIDEALAGFGDPTVVYIAALFIVSEALDATGVTAWVGQQLVSRAGASRTRLLVLTMLLCAGLTALISVNGAVAALIPVVVVTAVRLHESPSRLLLPMAFAAHAGSMLALTGSPVNVIVSNAAKDAGGDYFGFFEFTLAGIPLLAGTVAVVVVFGERLVAKRSPRHISRDFSEHARTLARHYELDDPPAGRALRPTRRRGRGDRPSPVGDRRRHGVPGDGHRQWRPGGPRRAAQRRRRRPRDHARPR